MPISLQIPIRRLSQAEFREISYEVMRHVFDIQNEIGHFFDEAIYKRELAHRIPGTRLEEPIKVAFGSFQTQYFIDVLVNNGGIFEFKAVESLSGRHRAQLLNYLLLCDLSHGKLINVGTAAVEHEFVNTQWRYSDRLNFEINTDRWDTAIHGAGSLQEYLLDALRDLGVGLEVALYEELVMDFLGGKEQVESDVRVQIDGHEAGQQPMRMLAPGVAFKVTGLDHSLDDFETPTRRLLAHVDLRAIAWININMKQVTFTTLTQ